MGGLRERKEGEKEPDTKTVSEKERWLERKKQKTNKIYQERNRVVWEQQRAKYINTGRRMENGKKEEEEELKIYTESEKS